MNSALVSGALLLCGAFSVLCLQKLPSMSSLAMAGVAACALMVFKRWRWAGTVLSGFVLMCLAAAGGVAQKLDPDLAGRDHSIRVAVVGFVEHGNRLIRLIVSPLADADFPDRIRLSWYDAAQIPTLGECWQLTVRLRRPRGMANPGGFDYEGWLFRTGIGATGYVRAGERIADCNALGATDALRKHAVARLTRLLPNDNATAVLLAITVGARHRISAQQWRQYAVTGTSHLMAISGMHIGLAAWSSYRLTWILLGAFRRSGNVRTAAALTGLVVATGYAALSGFAVPARRALLMLAMMTAAFVLRRSVPHGHLLGICCLLVAATSPLDILSPGFQLSFAAVATLLILAHRSTAPGHSGTSAVRRAVTAVRGLTVLQITLLLGLLPLTAAVFSRAALLAPVVNLIVLPIFNLVTVPLALLGLLMDGASDTFGDLCLVVAWHSVRAILAVVGWFAQLPVADRTFPALGGLAMLTAFLPLLWVLLPVGWPGRRLAVLAAVAAMTWQPPRPPQGCVDIHILDVGQGLASVLVTRRRVLVFDAGPAFRSGTDTGQLVVTPFLQGLGVPGIDILLVSHGDLDHAGGVASLENRWQIGAILAGESRFGARRFPLRCETGQLWHWDGVTFAVLHPERNGDREGNNASCVVEVRSGRSRALLTGDVEARAERQLLHNRMLSPVELVVIPHHGSATSSVRRFTEVLAASEAVASAGFDNRWGMPKPDVVARWQATGATVRTTADEGALSYRLCRDSPAELRRRGRVDARKIWHDG